MRYNIRCKQSEKKVGGLEVLTVQTHSMKLSVFAYAQSYGELIYVKLS